MEKERESWRYVENIIEKIPEDSRTDDVEEYIGELVDKMELFDMFYESDGMDDDGAEVEMYFLIENKLYRTEIFCEADWCGDWSARKNIPGDISVVCVDEVEKFEIVKGEVKTGGSITVKIFDNEK